MPEWMPPEAWSTAVLVGALVASALVIAVAGVRAAAVAVGIVAATGLGQAVVGAVLLGAGTSIPEFVVTMRASMQATTT